MKQIQLLTLLSLGYADKQMIKHSTLSISLYGDLFISSPSYARFSLT